MRSRPGKLVLSSAAQIVAALSDERLIPPGAQGSGSTMALRAEMARFSPPAHHGQRRAEVEAAIASIDLAKAAELASSDATARLQRARLTQARVEVITTIGRPTAVATIATIFGVAAGARDEVVCDIEAMVAVIGRGHAPSVRSDEAVDRLSARFARHPLGRVAVLSALYQSMDATAALVATRLLGRGSDQPSAVPVARTTRIATTTAIVAGTTIPNGTAIDLEIGAAGLWFGAGPHACPGQALAEAIADAIVHSIVTSGAVLDIDSVDLDPDHRPVAVWVAIEQHPQ